MSPGQPELILASTSSYRADLLRRLGVPFRSVASSVDESALGGESPRDTAIRLAAAKARAVAGIHPGCLVIGSDQVAERDGRPLGKPLDPARACEQLRASSARSVNFHTAVCVLDGRSDPPVQYESCDTTRVRFRELGEQEIRRYLERDEPYDCAGSFKVERLGIALFERIETTDPSALIGLPLIVLCRLLRACGLAIP